MAFIQDNQLAFDHTYADSSSETLLRCGAPVMPTTLFFDSQGGMVDMDVGDDARRAEGKGAPALWCRARPGALESEGELSQELKGRRSPRYSWGKVAEPDARYHQQGRKDEAESFEGMVQRGRGSIRQRLPCCTVAYALGGTCDAALLHGGVGSFTRIRRLTA